MRYLTLSPLPVNIGTWNSIEMGGFYQALMFLVGVRLATAVKMYSLSP